MQTTSLSTQAKEHLAVAAQASSGRSTTTVYGGNAHVLRQTLITLLAGRELKEHPNPGEATVQVLSGHVRLGAGEQSWDGHAGDLLVVPDAPHNLAAIEDSAVLLTMAKHQ